MSIPESTQPTLYQNLNNPNSDSDYLNRIQLQLGFLRTQNPTYQLTLQQISYCLINSKLTLEQAQDIREQILSLLQRSQKHSNCLIECLQDLQVSHLLEKPPV